MAPNRPQAGPGGRLGGGLAPSERMRLRAARTSSTRPTGVLRGAAWAASAPSGVAADSAMRMRAWASASRVWGLSVSVGSIMSASSTISGKYTVGAWKPSSSSRLATSSAFTPVRFLRPAADATNSCMHIRS